MAGGGGTPGSAGAIELNVVPLVDVACLLIMFFILTSQFASANFAAMQLATPRQCQAQPVKPEEKHPRIIVNVVSKANEKDRSPVLSLLPDRYTIGNMVIKVEGEDSRTMLEKEIRRQMGAALSGKVAVDFTVEVRADRRVQFSAVEPVMTAAAQAVGNAKIDIQKFPIKMDLTAMGGS